MFWIGALPALTRALYPDESAGIGGVEAASRGEHGAGPAHRCGRVEALQLSRRAHDVHDVSLAWNAGSLYPDFLKEVHKISSAMVANIAMIYNVGAVVGAIVFGHLSQVAGRRKGMIAALGLSLLMIPLWAFGRGLPRDSRGDIF